MRVECDQNILCTNIKHHSETHAYERLIDKTYSKPILFYSELYLIYPTSSSQNVALPTVVCFTHLGKLSCSWNFHFLCNIFMRLNDSLYVWR